MIQPLTPEQKVILWEIHEIDREIGRLTPEEAEAFGPYFQN